MYDQTNDDASPLRLELLLDDAIVQILEHEDPDLFFDWIREHLNEYYSNVALDQLVDPQDSLTIATSLGRAIWNAVPLPGNNFRPRPLPEPGRNHSCPCGSGKKYKQCCARRPALPAFDGHLLWFPVLEQLQPASLKDVIARGRVPIEVLVNLADQYSQQHQPKKGASLLEPLFAGPVRKPDEAHDYALNLLCNLYDDLGHHKKKATLLQRVIDTTRRSPLRSGALQRTAAIHMDSFDVAGAWEAFRQAQQDDPNSLSLGVLEVQLLMAEDRMSEAQARANFWIKRLRRSGLAHDEGPLEFLSAIARDPLTAMKDVGLGMADGAGAGLDEWLQKVAGRPVADYLATKDAPELDAGSGDAFSETMEARLRNMGVAQEEIEQAMTMLQQELELNNAEEGEAEAEAEAEDEADDPMDTLFLSPPLAIEELEAHWHEVFPLDKPFSIHNEPFGSEEPWSEEHEERWMAFLNDHPEAFDSLDIIDDLVTALMLHDQYDTSWLDEALLKPLLLRAASTVNRALSEIASPRIVWAFTENRPALRSLARLVDFYFRSGEESNAITWASRLLALNPHDNHGLRSLVVNQLLFDGDDAGMLEIAANYPQDAQAEIPYGKVLALYRLQRLEEAQIALHMAMEDLPKIPRFLSARRVRMPKLDPMGVQYGGDDQAWLYRDAMRDVWLETPGAIDWLKKEAKRSKWSANKTCK
jgi:tetratricopeptide (TPR) repeat protein